MKKMFIFMLLTVISSCKAQKVTNNLNNEQNEILKIFLLQQGVHGYIDKHFFNINNIKRFSGNFKQVRKLYRKADSICNISSDTTKIKFFCSLADSFKVQSLLLNDNDLDFLINKYDAEKEKYTFNLDTLISNTTLRKHSDSYYKKIVYDKYDGIPDLKEFPSIRINNIYLNETKNVAVVSYTIVYERINSSSSSFYLLEKRDNMWWKPLGNLKL